MNSRDDSKPVEQLGDHGVSGSSASWFRWLGPLALVVAIVSIVILVRAKPQPQEVLKKSAPLVVEVIELAPVTTAIEMTARGSIVPRWQSVLSSEVGGRVLAVSQRLLSGASFKKGDWLVKIDKTNFRLALETANSNLAQAELLLVEEQQLSSRALRDWQRSGLAGEPSALVLRQPQLSAVQAAVKAAKAQVVKAKADLARTVVTAPYNGAVISRRISLGEVVVPNQEIATIYADDIMEVAVPLKLEQWALLDFKSTQPVTLRVTSALSPQLTQVWNGYIDRQAADIETTTRQRNLMVAVDKTVSLQNASQQHQHKLVPGLFVTVSLPGLTMENLLAVPESAMTVDKRIWLVDREQRLKAFPVTPVFSREGKVFVKASLLIDSDQSGRLQQPFQLVARPLKIFLEDMVVESKMVENETQKNIGEHR